MSALLTVSDVTKCFGGIEALCGNSLTIEAGADFPGMLVRLAAGHRVKPAIGRFKSARTIIFSKPTPRSSLSGSARGVSA